MIKKPKNKARSRIFPKTKPPPPTTAKEQQNCIKTRGRDFPGGPVGKTLRFHGRGVVWIQSLVRKLRSCVPCGGARKKKEGGNNGSEQRRTGKTPVESNQVEQTPSGSLWCVCYLCLSSPLYRSRFQPTQGTQAQVQMTDEL